MSQLAKAIKINQATNEGVALETSDSNGVSVFVQYPINVIEILYRGIVKRLPNNLNKLTSLSTLDLTQCSLIGKIPILSGLSNLVTFRVYNNQLTGNIPSLSGLSSLVTFRVYNNQLTGNIPSLTGLSSLVYFYVYNNQLSTLTDLPSREDLNLQLQNNAMTVAEVNENLFICDRDLPTATTGQINIAGSNAYPDGTSGGFDGLTALSNLLGKGWTVTTS